MRIDWHNRIIAEINGMIEGRRWEIDHDYAYDGTEQAEINVLEQVRRRIQELETEHIAIVEANIRDYNNRK